MQLLITNNLHGHCLSKPGKYFAHGEKLQILTLGFSGTTYLKRNLEYLERGNVDYGLVDLEPFHTDIQEETRNFCLNFKYAFPRKRMGNGLNLMEIFTGDGYNKWWFTGLSEMGSFRTPFVEDIHSTVMVKRVIQGGYSHVLLDISEDPLRRVLVDLIRARGVTCTPLGLPRTGLKVRIRSSFYIAWILQSFRFLLSQLIKYLLFSSMVIGSEIKNKAGVFLFFSFYPSLWSKREDGGYTNKIFSVIVPEVEKSFPTHNVIFITHLKPFFKNILKDRKQLRTQGIVFLENHISLLDIMSLFSPESLAAVLKYKWRFEPEIKESYEGVDISPLVRKAMQLSLTDPEFFRDILIFRSLKKISNRFRLGGIVHTVEFQCYEKAIWSATQAKTNTYGFQHSAIGKNWLNYYFLPQEIQEAYVQKGSPYAMPLPDKLITAGNYPDMVMRENGFPEAALAKCGALRYDHLADYIQNQKSKIQLRHFLKIKPEGKVLTLLTGVNEEESIDMLESIFDALGQINESIELYYKAHPLRVLNRQVTDMHKASGIKHPLTVLPVQTNYFDYLASSDAVIFCNSTIGIESIALGTAAISFDNYHSIRSYDIIEVGDAVYHESSSSGILAALTSIFKDDATLKTKTSLWSKAIANTFYKLDGRSTQRFVKIVQGVVERQI